MKYAKRRRTGLWVAGFIIILEIMVVLLNRRRNESWLLFWYDLRSGFADNREYLFELIVCGVLVLLLLFILFVSGKYNIKLKWKICVMRHRISVLLKPEQIILVPVLLTICLNLCYVNRGGRV